MNPPSKNLFCTVSFVLYSFVAAIVIVPVPVLAVTSEHCVFPFFSPCPLSHVQIPFPLAPSSIQYFNCVCNSTECNSFSN